MNHSERNKKIEEFFDSCIRTAETKGLDYAGPDDANFNFKSVGECLGIHPRIVLLVYMKKHFDRLTNTIKANPKNPVPYGETLEESCKDLALYSAILTTL